MNTLLLLMLAYLHATLYKGEHEHEHEHEREHEHACT